MLPQASFSHAQEMDEMKSSITEPRRMMGYKVGVDDPKKMLFDFGRSTRRSFKFLDNIPTPILGPQYARNNNPNNPFPHADLW